MLLGLGLTRAERTQGEIAHPKLFFPVSNGVLVGAQNGLYLIQKGTTATRISGEESVNDIQSFAEGFLVGTDSRACSPTVQPTLPSNGRD